MIQGSEIREAPPPAPRWQSVRVDRGWPPTWERTHCGSCEAPWWTLERTTDGWRLWRLPSRAAYDYGRVACVFPTAGEADAWLADQCAAGRATVCDCAECEHCGAPGAARRDLGAHGHFDLCAACDRAVNVGGPCPLGAACPEEHGVEATP